MGDGRGWYGDADRHAEAAKKGQRSRSRSIAATIGKYLLLLVALPMQAVARLVPVSVELPSRVSSAIVRFIRPVFRFLSLFNDGGRFLANQMFRTLDRTGAFLRYLSLDRLVPSGLADQGQELIELTPKALGLRGTKRTKQFSAAVILGVLAYFASFLTGGLLIGAAIFLTVMALVAIARNVPVVNENWRDWTAALGIDDDYDVPGWSRD